MQPVWSYMVCLGSRGADRDFTQRWRVRLHVEMKCYDFDECLIIWCEDSWACIKGCASNLLKSMMVFGVLYSNLVGPSWKHMEWKEPVSWRVCVGSWWVFLRLFLNKVLLSCSIRDTFVGRLIWYFSSVEWWESMNGAFRLDSWAELGILQLILEFVERC